eukprot:8388777-Pyramimonas_sp.AAC.1
MIRTRSMYNQKTALHTEGGAPAKKHVPDVAEAMCGGDLDARNGYGKSGCCRFVSCRPRRWFPTPRWIVQP